MDDRDVDSRLSQRLRAYESRLPETDAPDPRHIRPRGGIRWPAVAGVFGAAVILGAAAGATVLLNRSPQPVGSDEPATSTPPESIEPTTAGWMLEPLPGATGPVEISDVALLSDGRAVVVGADARVDGTLDPAAWYDDGAGDWERAEISGSRDAGDFPSAFQMGPIVATDDRLVSIGIGESGAVIYTSSDSGESWVRQFAFGDPINESGGGIDGFVLDVERGPSGYVAVGHLEVPEDRVGSAAMIWTSADALHWLPAGDALGVRAIAPGIVTDVAFGDDRLLAVGSTWDEDGTHPRSAVWASTDGLTWAEISAGLANDAASSVIATADGFLLGGAVTDTVNGGLAAAWFSLDGESWQPAAMTAGQARTVSSFAASANGFIAIGDRMDHAEAWASADGRAWSRLPGLPTQGRSAAMAVAASEAVILAAGTVEPNAAPRQPVVWRMSTGDVESPTPTATSAPASPTSSPTSGVSWDTEAAPLDLAHVHGIVADGGRIYALGNGGRQDAVVLSSDDGLTWQRAVLPFPATWNSEPYVDHFASHLVSIDGRLVAFGTVGQMDFLNVVVWESPDGGTTWSELPTGDFMIDAFNVVDATAGPAGLILATNDFSMATGSVWHSIDGRTTWNEVRPGELLNLRAVVGTATGYVLVGSQCGDSSCAARHPRIWTSTDGLSWAPATVEGDDFVGEVEQVTISGAGIFAAIGSLDGRRVSWNSADAAAWALSADLGLAPPFTVPAAGLTGLPNGFVAVDASAAGQIVTWTSSDGVVWTAQDSAYPTIGGEEVLSFAKGIARIGDRLLLAGQQGHDPASPGAAFSWAGTIER